MNPRAGIGILVCSIGILSAHAQSGKKDSLQQKKEGEIYINQEAVKNIEFNFLPQMEIMKLKPKMDETKPWMEFRKELPMNMTDTTTIRKKDISGYGLIPFGVTMMHTCVIKRTR